MENKEYTKDIMNKEIRFCRMCGRELLKTMISADKIKIWYPDGMGGSLYNVDNKFDGETGEINMVEQLVCPQRKRFFSNHEKVVKYKDEYHYL